MAASVWKGSISFGLLSIPIRLFPAARSGASTYTRFTRNVTRGCANLSIARPVIASSSAPK